MTLAKSIDRCLRVVISCKTMEQLNSARKYCSFAHAKCKSIDHSIFFAAIFPKIVELEIKFGK